jgi:hypothetical protein
MVTYKSKIDEKCYIEQIKKAVTVKTNRESDISFSYTGEYTHASLS